MNGKSKCKLLKEIRRQIAQNNEIDYVTSECKYQGDCTGTCPKCEAEVRYLEQELSKRRQLGKTVAVAGIAAALMVGMSGCGLGSQPDPTQPSTLGGVIPEPSQTELVDGQTDPSQDLEVYMGEPVELFPVELQGNVRPIEIMGDVALTETEP